MLKEKKIKKIIFLKKIIQKKNEIKKKIILKSIFHNNELKTLKKIFSKVSLSGNNFFKNRKNCLMGVAKKSIDRKSKFSRFFIHKLNCNNLNQNYKINEK